MTPKIALALFISFATSAAFACDYPARAELPNGATASKEEMLAGQRSVKDFMAAMEAYLSCIDTEEKDAVAALEISDEEKASREANFTKRYNAAVEEMELVAAKFNEEVRAYREQGNR